MTRELHSPFGAGPKAVPGPDRAKLLGVVFSLIAAVGVPLAAALTVSPRAVLASGPVQSMLDVLRGPFNERALERIDGLRPLIEASAKTASVDPALVGAIIFAESRGVPGQTSSAGALGLMQLVPAAARDAAKRSGIEVPAGDKKLIEALLHDNDLNVSLGAAHLAWLLEHRGEWGDEAVLVSYNAGRAKLFRWIEREGSFLAWVQAEEARARAGERTTGSLAYARQVLGVRATLMDRWR